MEYQKTKAVCNFFIEKAKEEGTYLTPMQAIKLVYIAHGYSLAIFEKPLIDDQVEAWKFGAVIPSLYQELKIYGSRAINSPIINDDVVDKLDLLIYSQKELAGKYKDQYIRFNFDKKDIELMDAVWDVYKKKTGPQLSELIHQDNTPWDIIWNKRNGKNVRHAIIPDTLIKKHYKELIGE